MTSATFTQFVSEQDACNAIQLNVTKWSLMLCDALTHDAPKGYKYIIESGRKYHKIIMIDDSVRNHCSVHAFVDKKTGEVYKSAGWKAPAKGVRYDMRLIDDRERLLSSADWAGGYLYK